jgi:predicted lipid-binding transport protein (Tim44 family)
MAYEVMKELVTTEQATGVIRALAVALPPVGAAVGALAGVRRKRVRQGLLIGLLAGLVGPAVWLLWGMYNAIMGRFGLDSVAGLLINTVLFSVIGVAVGVAIRLSWRRGRSAPGEAGVDS